ncbi:putative phosphoenolpyruvate synthase, partial [Araneus ventricosus]
MSDSLKAEIRDVLLNLYESVEHVRFSIRSSACGEDSEDLSAAGQMLTVLGVRGINNITDAVIKCWSSKFGYEAVQYARQNGQSIKSSMAVVIQEMVPSEVSGVLFTVDPVTGDPSNLCVTANYGLGE